MTIYSKTTDDGSVRVRAFKQNLGSGVQVWRVVVEETDEDYTLSVFTTNYRNIALDRAQGMVDHWNKYLAEEACT